MEKQTYSTYKQLGAFHSHKIIEVGLDGKKVMVKDTTDENTGKEVSDVSIYLNSEERVAIRYKISSLPTRYEYNFNPDNIHPKGVR